MGVSPGTRLGPYEVAALIGAGGMGEVYRAVDTRLDRAVAVKILPPDVSADPDRHARFEREARTVASLSHPNIVAIHDVGTEAGLSFVVMELLEGQTLAERVADVASVNGNSSTNRRGLPVRKALGIAAQIAQGLAAAHARGIVHRDLKPANVFLTTDGRAKILDFGLARALVSASADAHTRTAAHQAPGTQPGVVLGTVGYMAPEQVRGREADHRADIFALGVVLYEMVTGARAFAADSPVETMSAILRADPLELRDAVSGVPPAVEAVIRRCLEKQPDERFQSARDLAFQLENLASDSGSSDAAQRLRDDRFRFSPRSAALIGAALATGVLLGGGWFAWRGADRSGVSQEGVKYTELLTAASVVATWVHVNLAISPDGERVVYTGRAEGATSNQLFQRALAARDPVPIHSGAGALSYSLDGRSVAFVASSRVWMLSLDGGKPVDLCANANSFGLVWGTKDDIFFAENATAGLWTVRAGGGDRVQLTTVNRDAGEAGHVHPSSSLPDGSLLFAVWYQSGRHNVAAFDFKTRTHKVVLENSSRAIYVPGGYLVYSRHDGLYAKRFDVKKREVVGPEVLVVRDVYLGERTNLGVFDVSRTGTLVYRPAGPIRPREMLRVDMNNNATPLQVTPRRFMWPQFSPDGKKIAAIVQEGEYINPFVYDIPSGRVIALKLNAHAMFPMWTPDSSALVFRADLEGAGKWKFYRQAADGSGGPVELPVPYVFSARSWADTGLATSGKVLLGSGRSNEAPVGAGASMIAVGTEGKPEVKTLISGEPGRSIANVRLSPDGKVVAYVWAQGNRSDVWVASYPGLSERRPVSVSGGWRLFWGPNGRLFYCDESHCRKQLLEVTVQSSPLRVSTSAVRFSTLPSTGGGDYLNEPNWDISPDADAKHFVMLKAPDEETKMTHLNLIQNLVAELRKKLPER